MPIYEYDCASCGSRFDKLVFGPAREQAVLCPTCGSEQVLKRLSLIAGTTGGSRESGTASTSCTTST